MLTNVSSWRRISINEFSAAHVLWKMRRILSALALLAYPLAAQVYTEPPLLIHLVRGQHGPPYEQAQAAVNVIAMSSLTGPPEFWRIAMHPSFASVEETNEAIRRAVNGRTSDIEQLSPDLFGDSRSLIAVYRPGLSYRSDQAIRMFAKARYYYVSVHRVRLGAGGDFGASLRVRREGLDVMNLDRPDLAYQVVAGAPTGTYVLLAPMLSLGTLDDGLAKRAYQADQGTNKSESELFRSHLLFRVEPTWSYVSDEFAAEANEFWRPKR